MTTEKIDQESQDSFPQTSAGSVDTAAVSLAEKSLPTSGAEDSAKDDKSPTTWAENWREIMAGEDKSSLKTLQRYADPTAVWKKTLELQKKFSSGDIQLKLPENATPEEKAEWRKQQGIPDTYEGYKLDLGKYSPTEDDIAVFDEFKKFAHENDLPPNAVNVPLKWYMQQVEKAEEVRKELDDSFKQKSEDLLREQWGPDYRGNTNVINNFLSKQSDVFRQSLEDARLSNGTRLMDNPEIKKWMAETALELNPMARILPSNASPSAGQGRIDEIERIQKTNFAAYSKDPKMQDEYYQLIQAREKINSRN